MKNVLVFPCGSEIGLEIFRSLECSKDFKLFGANSVDDHGKYTYENYIPDVPFIDDDKFIPHINQIIADYKIDFIMPAHDSAVLKMSSNQHIINAIVVTSCIDTCRICRSKGNTYEYFKGKIPVPRIYGNAVKFPVFLKPDIGQGSKGTHVAYNHADIDFYIQKDFTLLTLEYLPGKEYTVDCFTDRNRKLLFCGGRERVRISNGISVNSKKINNPKFRELAEIINRNLHFQGAWFFQVKERETGELVLMEIAPRIAGTMELYRVSGINFAQLSLYDRMGIDVDIIDNKQDIEIDRALCSRFSHVNYDTVYVDLDDTIIVNSKVNASLMKFLYKARNELKRIILITKHEGGIYSYLNQYAISDNLFDEIIVISKDESKISYIHHEPAIFIDDSFKERKAVYDRLKIPVFSLDAVESLI